MSLVFFGLFISVFFLLLRVANSVQLGQSVFRLGLIVLGYFAFYFPSSILMYGSLFLFFGASVMGMMIVRGEVQSRD